MQAEPDTRNEHGALGGAVLHALEHAAHLLPDQAPMRVFVHHNTLHAFQHLPFHQAVREAHQVYGAEPYLSEARYRQELSRGRITAQDLDAALAAAWRGPDQPLLSGKLSKRALWRTLLLHELRDESHASVTWLVSEGRHICAPRADLSQELRRSVLSGQPPEAALAALYQSALEQARGYRGVASEASRRARLHRDILLERTGEDALDTVAPALIRLLAAFLDDGLAAWHMPRRELGFYGAAREVLSTGLMLPTHLGQALARRFQERGESQRGALEVVTDTLEQLGVGAEQAEEHVLALLLSLPGWAGMVSRLERHPGERPAAVGQLSLLDYLAVRLSYEHVVLEDIARRHLGEPVRLAALLRDDASRSTLRPPVSPEQLGYRLFSLAQLLGLSSGALAALPRAEVHALLEAADEFDPLQRQQLFQEAYEHHYRTQILSALAAHRPHVQRAQGQSARFQVISCFDEREESLRRHIEEVAPDAQTFGAPGFFGAAMRYRGLDDLTHVPLAPVVIQPVHLVEERPHGADQTLHEARARRRALLTKLQKHLARGTRSLWRGTLLNGVFGMAAAFPLLLRVVSPRLSGKLRRVVAKLALPEPRSELVVQHDARGALSPGEVQRGYTLAEQTVRVATMLENIGLTSGFAPLVLVLGHGSTTLNNPHKSAYDCGACGGRQGGPNARAFAKMANDPAVRGELLRQRNIRILDQTWFVGGQHDTCEDSVTLFDLALVPRAFGPALEAVRADLDQARARNAQERCRRLFSAPRKSSPYQALRHVEARAEHLAEPRPEFGHATNAVAIIGRRSTTRGLFLDRRAFLISYDPTIDADGVILERTLAAATPVGAGINLEYYFSAVDNERYGAGSKLPHNVTGLIGVMSGHASDLRTGLPRQMIEIHEPMRLLVIVEATPERLLDIAARQAEVRELVVNRWVQLVALDPDSGAMHVFGDDGFEPFQPDAVQLPELASSPQFFSGHADFLPPARIRGRAA